MSTTFVSLVALWIMTRCAKHLLHHGVKIDREAFHGGARGMGHSFYIFDPFGNKIEIKGPAVYPDGRSQAAPASALDDFDPRSS